MNPVGAGFRNSVIQARNVWTQGRKELRELHTAGGTGEEVTRRMSDLLDGVLRGIYQSAIEEISPDLASRISLVLLGGCGRQDIAPFSDIDLMMLYQGTVTDDIVEFSRRICQDITDVGLQLGYSLRTPRDACSMALRDAYIFSSLTESRFLVGNEGLFRYFQGRFLRISKRRTGDIIRAIIQAREQERIEFGETVYLLRPNIKKSRGGLRDIHLIRWLGFVQFSETNLDRLLAAGALSTADTKQLKTSREFLLRVRNEMHFHANRANDGLGRNEQVRLAEFFGYTGDDAILSVEEFMRDYFRRTSRIQYICDHFVSKSQRRKKGARLGLRSLSMRKIDAQFRIGADEIGVVPEKLDAVKGDLEQVLRLMQLACLHDKKIEHATWIVIRHEMLKFPEIPFTREAARRFMALLSNTQRLPKLLFRLHEMKALQKIIPEFTHARGLLQFNEYHMYTVDEHSLRAVANAVAFEHEDSVVGRVYRKIREKNVLHLALLLHDLGKGLPGDHSEIGRDIAEKTGRRFDLDDDTTENIKFLVHNHLVMSHLAFHRDINDHSLVAEFASNVGSVELLAMLYVLTCADIAAVGPGVLTPWKQQLLTDLYIHAKTILTGDNNEGSLAERFEMIYDRIAEEGETPEDRAWIREKVVHLPNNYCMAHPPEVVAQELMMVKQAGPGEVLAWADPIENSSLYELRITTGVQRRSGLFYKIIGMLSSLGIRIRATDIKLLDESTMFFWIQFEDPDFSKTPEERLQAIQDQVHDLLLNAEDFSPRFRQVWQKGESVALQLSRPEIQVKINNQTVDTATIIDVFAYDKTGLLYKIAKKLYRLGLDVTYVRLSTYAHQVIGVFYVTDEGGNKIRNRNQLHLIRRELLRAVKDFLEPQEATGTKQERSP